MSDAWLEYIRHIYDECHFVTSVITPQTSKEAFLRDETLKRAVVRSLEIIGEASKKIPPEVRLLWPDIPWRNMA